ncbi:hypothetical protein PR048_008432 [Dryococelus australis]|uniref:Secreted protein n=1 Tax=Dryococelus australis TaxID=614101 RepID=A0ABQ9HYT7_9NEOP|nr:hypothetical protein PR048_008432 [Dryococelus australis]
MLRTSECTIAAKCRAVDSRAVFSSCCVCLWDLTLCRLCSTHSTCVMGTSSLSREWPQYIQFLLAPLLSLVPAACAESRSFLCLQPFRRAASNLRPSSDDTLDSHSRGHGFDSRSGDTVAERLTCSPLTMTMSSIPGLVTPDFRMWESYRAMTLIGGFCRGYPVSPSFHSGAAPCSSQPPSSDHLKTSISGVISACHVVFVGPRFWATVVERLACSRPTKANRVQSPAGSPHFCNWESCRTMPLLGGFFSGISRLPRPFIPTLLHIHFSHLHRLSRPRC